MQKVFWLICALVGIFIFILYLQNKGETLSRLNNPSLISPSPQAGRSGLQDTSTSLFVPYWSVTDQMDIRQAYDHLIYFGISPTSTGINTQDAGYLRLSQFINSKPAGQKAWLALRMLDSKTNFEILKDSARQNVIISETVNVAKKYQFDGVVLDLELSALPFESLIQQINTFTQRFSTAARKEQLRFVITAYGDTFYRVRPFDIKTLATSADQVMIMAYDLHKAGGNPGPNFPLSGKNTYGYDYASLMDNFLKEVPAEKLTIVFGLFGYDWQVDDKDIAQSVGAPLSYLEIQKTIMDKCSELQCEVKRDSASAETIIRYMDDAGKKHIVWFEDVDSVSAKQTYLQQRGVHNFSYWAYTYFN